MHYFELGIKIVDSGLVGGRLRGAGEFIKGYGVVLLLLLLLFIYNIYVQPSGYDRPSTRLLYLHSNV